MAKPISTIESIVIDEETRKRLDLDEVESALAERKDAVLETVELIGHLHDRGILSLLNGLFAEGDEVFRIAVKEINKPDHSDMIQNLVGLVSVLGKLDIESLKDFAEKANRGLKEATDVDPDNGPSNIFQLLKVLKDPEINRGITMMLHFLKGMGKE
ncbi:MAG TPA: DUF1641 domain-containing protein [Bacillales bacterium]|nr:DUF1641 domain-containing protein [Bacillales bacterium]